MTTFQTEKSWNDGWNGATEKTGLSFQKSFRERKVERKPSKTPVFINKIKPFQWNGFYSQITVEGGGVYTPSPDWNVPHPFLEGNAGTMERFFSASLPVRTLTDRGTPIFVPLVPSRPHPLRLTRLAYATHFGLASASPASLHRSKQRGRRHETLASHR
ncbi:hypothetical protein IYX23_07745 [Methylocystis sp. L43]|uniref:hypothetical protein n=1 Tax=unclassified Methylocystis TaxID=2625913 RepID=UPI0018C20B4C|nr:MULTISPECIES: hypothetical protein [unclassified Methylocystis]MBG0797559.1 hypothetical protein [Methylocystis sp. L43]MBG0805163.1 hypothetical protein [Methylocystis sp. H15]